MLRNRTKQDKAAPADPAPVFMDARSVFAERFLSGRGLEIGALHQPLSTPAGAKVRYVDRMPVDQLRAEYPELAGWDLTPVDVIDDGELLATVPEASQDFIIANHFLEHCEDPIGTIATHLGKLRPGGVLFYAVPDKRFTFDYHRELTPLGHMIADHEEGPERSRAEHYDQWSNRLVVEDGVGEQEALAHARELEAARYSIHMHVWTQAEFLQMIIHCRERHGEAFDIEAAGRQGIEFVVVLRKQGPPRRVPAQPGPSFGARAKRRLRAALRH